MKNNKSLLLVVGVLSLVSLILTAPYVVSRFNESGGGGFSIGEKSQFISSAEPLIGSAGYSGRADIAIAPYPPSVGGDALDEVDRYTLSSSSMSLVAKDPTAYLSQYRDYLSSVGAVVTSYSAGKWGEYRYGNLEAKVPLEKFDEAVSRAKNNTQSVYSEDSNFNDITGSVATYRERSEGLQQQLDEMRASLKSLNEGSVEYVRMSNQIRNLENQLNQNNRSLENMQTETQYGMIMISVASKESYFGGSSQVEPLSELSRAFESLKGSLSTILVVVIWAVVYAIVWLPIALVTRWLWRRFK